MDWNAAERDCVRSGAHLTSIHSSDEIVFIGNLQIPAAVRFIWIGGQRTGQRTFNWTDGTNFNYTNWSKREPNNHGGQENCVMFHLGPGQPWNDAPCKFSLINGYICKKQI